MHYELRKKISTAVIALLVTVWLFPSTAGAFAFGKEGQQKGGDRKSQHRPAQGIWRDSQMIDELGLTDEQIKQIRDADFAFRENHLTLKAQLDRFHLEMEKALSADTVDDQAVLKTANTIADVKGTMFVLEIESRLALGRILTADQSKILGLYDLKPKKKGSKPGKKSHAKHHLSKQTQPALSESQND